MIRKAWRGLRKLDEQFPGILIHPERGVPQGDTGSPLIWLAYDILLRALTIQRQQLQDRLAHAVNCGDDLKSIAGLGQFTGTGQSGIGLCCRV